MKKALRFILAGVVALLAVSCYDDSALQEKVDKLDGRLTAVENTLNQEVADLAALVSQFKTLEGKVAAIKVETKDGLTTLTLSNGSSVVLSKDGVLTMVDGGWATVAPNGDVTPLNIPVSQKLKFIVEGNILKVSYDDGKTYESTGVEVAEPTAHVIGNIVVAEDGKSVAITIGDNTLSLPLVSSAVATLGLSRDNFFLRYDAEKKIEISASNLSEIYVMNEPDGWKADIKDDVLVISSPSKKAVEADAAHKDGLVLVHATTTEGKCIVAKIEVTTGPGLEMVLDGDTLRFTNAYTQVETYMGEVMGESFAGYAVGIVPVAEVADRDEFFQTIVDDYDAPAGGLGNMDNYGDAPYFEEGVCEIQKVNMTIEQLYNWIAWYDEDGIDAGVEYMIYAAPMDEKGRFVKDEVIIIEHTYLVNKVEISNITCYDAEFKINVKGATSYIVMAYMDPAVMYGPMISLEMLLSEGGAWAYIMYGAASELPSYEPGEHTFKLSDIYQFMGSPIKPATKYYYFVFPYIEGTVYTDYATQFEPYVGSFETAPLQPGGPETVLSEGEKVYGKVNVSVTKADAAEVVKYYFYSPDEWANFDEDEDAIREDLMEWGNEISESEELSYTCKTGNSCVFAAVSIGEGKYGEVNYVTLSPKAIVKEAAFATTLDFLSIADGKYTAEVSVAGGATKLVGCNLTKPNEASYDRTVADIENNIATKLGTYTSYQWVDVVDGKATFVFNESSAKKDYFVFAYTVDADGVLEKLCDKPLVFNIAENVFTFDLEKLEIGGGTLLNLAAPWSEIESGSKDYDIYVKMKTAAGVEWKVSATKNGEAYTDPNSPMLSKTYAGNVQSDHMWVPLNNTNDPIEWALTVTTTYAGKEISKTVQFTQKGAPVVEQDFFNIVKVHNGGLGQLNLTEPWSEIPATFDWTNMGDGTTDLYVNVEASKTWSISVTKNGEPYSHSGGVFGKEYAGSRQSDHIWLTPNTTGAPVEWAVTVTALVNGEQVAKTIKFTQKAN